LLLKRSDHLEIGEKRESILQIWPHTICQINKRKNDSIQTHYSPKIWE